MEYRVDRAQMLERFLSYVEVWTTSDENCAETPSSQRQFDLGKQLRDELTALGLENVRLDDNCYVYATLPERFAPGSPRAGKAPSIGLIAHMDVSEAVPGENVKPVIHENYQGQSLVLPGDPEVVLDPAVEHPLGECKGLDIITSDGTTLLGADDKAGVAIIMSVLDWLRQHPEFEHGPLQIGFTPDEEIGRGADKFDVAGFGAEVAYTFDGEGLGEVEDETFCADSLDVTFRGINVHPGYAKGKMVNAIKAAADLVASLPRDGVAPETTADREGYVHPRLIEGNEEKAVVKFLIRAFDMDQLAELGKLVTAKAEAAAAAWPGSKLEVELTHSYKNMKAALDQRPEAVGFAIQAVQAAGVSVVNRPIRGGTDGARLSLMGLPTPNIFTGGHNFHGKKEWIAIQHMEKSAEVCLRLVELWGQQGVKKGLLPPME